MGVVGRVRLPCAGVCVRAPVAVVAAVLVVGFGPALAFESWHKTPDGVLVSRVYRARAHILHGVNYLAHNNLYAAQ